MAEFSRHVEVKWDGGLMDGKGTAHAGKNLQFLHKSINHMKGTMTMDEFTEFFDKVALARILGEV